MNQKNVFTTGIALAFLLGVGLTFVLMQSAFVQSLQGSITNTPNTPVIEQVDTGCSSHDQCEQGFVCKTGECVLAETSFCSQPYMLAESVEGRFVRYTQCPNRCVVSGDTAFCQ